MQVQLITLLLSLCFSLTVLADDESEVKDLFKSYAQVMDQHKTDLIEDVFTEKFITGAGGKKELEMKIKELPLRKSNSVNASVKIKQGVKDKDIIFAKLKEATQLKGNKESYSHSDFIIKRENGKLKIDGTISDGE